MNWIPETGKASLGRRTLVMFCRLSALCAVSVTKERTTPRSLTCDIQAIDGIRSDAIDAHLAVSKVPIQVPVGLHNHEGHSTKASIVQRLEVREVGKCTRRHGGDLVIMKVPGQSVGKGL